MKKTRVVVFVDAGLVVDVISDNPVEIEYLVIDTDRTSLDQSVMKLMDNPSRNLPFEDVCHLISSYGDSVYHDPEKVAEVFAVREERLSGKNFHVIG